MSNLAKNSLSGWLIILNLCATSLFAYAEENQNQVAMDQRRGVEQTLLTFPEWYLVHSPAEYASFVAHHPPHDFPFIGHISQLWSSYESVTKEQLRAGYPLNIGYHLMICVIASSTTIEYSIHSIYENTFGRLSWALSSEKLTDEDQYGALVARSYVDFIRNEPWYLFDFSAKLKGLWTNTPVWGSNIIRKWERRYALTTEYLIKAGYAKIIEFATRQAYNPALLTTQVVASNVPSYLPKNIKLVKHLANNNAVLDMPRYFDFRIAATKLAEMDCKLVDIAGNRSIILVTVWVQSQSRFDLGQNRVLFEQPIITMPGYKRVAVILPVSNLSDFLLNAAHQNLKIEHVYDY